MTPEEVREKLADSEAVNKEEMRIILANFMGWALDPDEGWPSFDRHPFWKKGHEHMCDVSTWQPDKDRHQLALVLRKLSQDLTAWTNFIIELDFLLMPNKYVSKYLAQKRPPEHYISFQSETLRDLMLAPPETICQAILKVIEKE